MNMTNTQPRYLRHIFLKLVVAALPAVMLGCSSGVSGHAPGLAGAQTLDPGTLNYPLAYIKRPPPTKDVDVRDLITSTTGGDLYVRDQASAGGAETNVTLSITGGMGDVRDIDVSMDGKKLLFSLRLPLDPKIKDNDDPRQPTWKIYEYDAVLKTVTQLTNDNTTAGHDVGAHYMPDGRIVFSSTRQAATQAILIDEGRPQYPAQTDDRKQPIFLLHVMNADGTNIHQVSFNTNHDFAPSVLANGQLVFSRYESINGDEISLYRTNPDGSKLELFYGENSHNTGANLAGTNNNLIQFLGARQRSDGKLFAIVRPFLGTQMGGDIVQIDADNFVEVNQAATPAGSAGTAQSSATAFGVTTDMNLPSLGGRFASVFPLLDGTNRLLVSWAPCLVVDNTGKTLVCNNANTSGTAVTQAAPQYTIWVYDLDKGTLSPILAAQSGLTIVEPVIMQARTSVPPFVPDAIPAGAAADLAAKNVGLLDIRSVYDFDGTDTVMTQTGGNIASIAALADPVMATANQRPARFIRIEKAVEIPDKTVRKINNSAFGPANMGMREILAYAPIEPDGSVKIQIPANVPFTIDILDKNARRIGAKHTSWLQLMPGETKSCNGCHTAGSTTSPSHGRAGLTASAYAGATSAGASFPNTVASLSVANIGDTMAETLAWNTCQTGATTLCSQLPSINVLYADVWTDPTKATVNASFSYLYSGTVTPTDSALSTPTPMVVVGACSPTWSGTCRSTIHYPLHIQPIWDFARPATSMTDPVPDHTCSTCHTSLAAAAVQVPSGQLDLTNATSNLDVSVIVSYESLLFPHNEQTINMGVLQDLLVAGPIDPTTGLPTMVPVVLDGPMTAGSANASTKFLGVFDGTVTGITPNHTNYLTPAELRLISEWLDIGAQYYNDPFVAPVAN